MIKIAKKLLPLIGIVLFTYIIMRMDFYKFWQTLIKIDYRYFFIFPILVFLILYLQILKWQFLLKAQDNSVSFMDLLKIHLVSNYYALITPSRLGYFMRILYLRDNLKCSTTEASSSVVIDRVLDIFILFLFALAGSFLVLNFSFNISLSFLLIVLIFIVLIILFYSKKRAKFFISFLKTFIPERFKDKLKNIFNKFYDSFPPKKKLLIPILLTSAVWIIAYSQMYLIALALNIHINYWCFIILVPISTVIGLLPITISGLGTREATLILIFSNYNVSAESIIAMSLISFAIVYCLPVLLGGFLSFKSFFK